MTEEVQKPAAVYRNEEKDYDVSKLSPEGQQAGFDFVVEVES